MTVKVMTIIDIMTIREKSLNVAVPVNEAKKELSHYIRQAEHGDPVVISRRGQPVAALVSTELLAQLERLQVAGPEAGLGGLVAWEGSDELIELLNQPRRSRKSLTLE